VPPVDEQQQDSYFVVAHLHYVLFGGSMLGIFAGIYYWFPKATGRMLGEGMGKLNFWTMMLGLNLTFFPMHFLGILGMPRRIYTYPTGMGWDLSNLLATIGAFILAVSILVFILNVVVSLRRGQRATDDPWDGATLEWTTSSPPPPHNFDRIPVVHSRDPLWAQKYGAHGKPQGGAAQPIAEAGQGDSQPVHMPDPSYYPIVVSLGLGLLAAGMIFGLAMSIMGGAIAVLGIYGWAFEPASARPHDAAHQQTTTHAGG
ncbi:MAG: cbb3-type cytochrome c oxidase subunit I, partial [Chloroflexota bacterium]|nr:cbb3-type cytochrome c oxidase subunit I [Chloroflexota bacterium]